MIKIISHRANLNGIDKSLENNPEQIKKVLKLFEVEIDLWDINGDLYLGHDEPQYKINNNFFDNKMWIHCKNLSAAQTMSKTSFNWFWHENDKLTQTSKGFLWCYPGVYLENGITVEFGYNQYLPKNIYGICTDYPLKYERQM